MFYSHETILYAMCEIFAHCLLGKIRDLEFFVLQALTVVLGCSAGRCRESGWKVLKVLLLHSQLPQENPSSGGGELP